MTWTQLLADTIASNGWAVTPSILAPSAIESAIASLSTLPDSSHRGGARNLLDIEGVRQLARSPDVRAAAEAVLGPECFAVRGLFFDKRPDANWWVPWHQDLTVAVADRRDVPGFGPWTVKAGVQHAQAPVDVLERMLAVRIHLDDCGPENGPLRLLPGSHTQGILGTVAIMARAGESAGDVGLASAGAILAFRPLLLHSSHPAESPSHRRVVHFEFAAGELPGGLEWRWRV